VAESFSDTREQPWEGWKIALNSLPINFWSEGKKVLDLGCGNGRFLDFLLQNVPVDSFEYLGLDVSSNILKIAQEKFKSQPKFRFEEKDVILEINSVSGIYDLVVAFGLTHHIPSETLREKWFGDLAKLVRPNGFLILTFWNFNISKAVTQNEIKGLEEGDYFRGWKHSEEHLRYVHVYNETEIQKIMDIQKQNGLTLVKDFQSGEKPSASNRTLIFRKV
jgi:SAM-dependent methyltransferase